MMVFTNEMTKAEQRPRTLIEPLSCSCPPSLRISRKNYGRSLEPHSECLAATLADFRCGADRERPADDPDPSQRQAAGRIEVMADVDAPPGRRLGPDMKRPNGSTGEGALKRSLYVEKKLINFVV